MKVLVIGSGGREHALVWKLSKSKLVKKIYAAPGNSGMKEAEIIPIQADDIKGLLTFAKKEEIDLTIVGPEAPLALGITDIFTENGLKIFGPSSKAAMLETSKSYAKQIMLKYNIPTAEGESFTNIDLAKDFIKKSKAPLVVKADGLAAGKGVVICNTEEEALKTVDEILSDRKYGDAGSKIVIEEFLQGEEASFIAISDGKNIVPLPSSQDHKAVYDGDKGANTGGMGAYSPAPIVDVFMKNKIMNTVMKPLIRGMEREGSPYKGFIYAGLMIDKDSIKVLEFNARLGDPEAQPLLMRIKSDIVPILTSTIDGTLDLVNIEIDPEPAVCVVMAAGGYPDKYETGLKINGLENIKDGDSVKIFHAGTIFENNQYLTKGGRVLGVTVKGQGLEETIKKAYENTEKIKWENVHFRKDIGLKALQRINKKPLVGIVMGSDSDLNVMLETTAVLKKFDIHYEMIIASAHRTPEKAANFASTAVEKGMKVIVAGAGHAAHLAGAMAASTTLPIIGVPIDSSALKGFDSLLSTVQMPPGVPVATMAVGKPGAYNAGILAVQIIALTDEETARKIKQFKIEMAEKVEKKAAKISI
ncbi:MAG: 5-(carboxyamino)imidazole ribonucleotide mutase [Deltaproteobacteria bacterium]|nr:MAG: 5-(carboxyamino)imidazole ribonucleotide mutase [Deltaproteobacteria bacterium]